MRFTGLLLLFIVALPCACLEMPITRVDKTRERIIDADAGADVNTDPQAACFACMAAPDVPGPGCETAFSACKINEKCDIIIQCGFQRQCFQGVQKEFLTCGLPCVTAGGVLTGDDPVLTLASTLFQCLANGPCASACFSTE
jgi:hypothetical protein